MSRFVIGRFSGYLIKDTALPVPGGQSKLYEVIGNERLIFKEFKAPADRDRAQRLDELITLGRSLYEADDATRPRTAVTYVAWPIDRVDSDGFCIGIILPQASWEFYENADLYVARSFGHLVQRQCPMARTRLKIVSQLAEALEYFDRYHMVHGDLSANNILWRKDPDPRILIVDCDGVRVRGVRTQQGFTPAWMDPRRVHGLEEHDHYSDWYSLALAVHRVLVLNARSTPLPNEYEQPIMDRREPLRRLLYRVFADPTDINRRVHPGKWRSVLASIAQDEVACAEIDRACAALRNSPDERRTRLVAGVSRSSPLRPSRSSVGPIRTGSALEEWVLQREATRAASSRAVGNPALLKSQRNNSPRKSRQAVRPVPIRTANRSVAFWLVSAVILAVGTSILAHSLSGWPHVRQLDRVNFSLSYEERKLVMSLPGEAGVCHRNNGGHAPGMPSVVCDWDSRLIVVTQFDSVSAADSFWSGRASSMVKVRGECGYYGDWSSGGEVRGKIASLSSKEEVSLEWYENVRGVYFSTKIDGDLKSACDWWKRNNTNTVDPGWVWW
ncbi:protein kinase domain-containing protein [Nocardia brasiliensis]|uniref:protein kinase domain-containing protein n=1 Tax=Nocardia brasiliensis TaxID=37326 RepID=UPI002458446D|nr:protein kinase [Nocardia brasiliensis]